MATAKPLDVAKPTAEEAAAVEAVKQHLMDYALENGHWFNEIGDEFWYEGHIDLLAIVRIVRKTTTDPT